MIGNFLLLIPGAGPFLAAGWNLLATPTGRRVVVFAVSIAASFTFGWSLKARMDRSATLQAVIAKQQIDLRAATQAAEDASAVVADLSETGAANQEIIDDLNERLRKRPAVASAPAACRDTGIADDAIARRLRQLR